MIPDLDILERRVAAMCDLPWVIPALIIVSMTDEDPARLDAVADQPHYWSVLNEVVSRIRGDAA